MNQKNENDLELVGELFIKLYEKYNRMESKKYFYKDIKDLTLIEINTILVIGHGGKTKKMSEIANTLGVSLGTPTVTMDRLCMKGYIQRTRDEEDRRQVFVSLSPKGEEVFHSIVALKNKITERIFGVLSPEERKSLITILAALNSKLDDLFINPI